MDICSSYTLQVLPSYVGLISRQPSGNELLSFCFLHSLEEVEVGFGIYELLDLLDLQASLFVGYNVSDPDLLAD
jgi:hypothetical protein